METTKKHEDYDNAGYEEDTGAKTENPPPFQFDHPPPGPKAPERIQWGSSWEFLMSCIATSVGLGNIWRFPYTAYQNGGGAFLIPYVIVLFVVGKPFYYLEATLGQFTSQSCVNVWSVSPAMKGVGYGHALAAFWVVTYYCSLMALTIYYLFVSFQSTLPWSYCREEWAGTCVDASGSSNVTLDNTTLSSSSELYFRKIVLKEIDSIEDGIGVPSWELTLCLAVSWVCVFFVQFRGVKSAGKAAYFLALFPYVMMITLLIRALTLEGAANGILFFVTPDWHKLYQPGVWYAAITQCFFSLSVCMGAIIMFSSYNNFRHNLYRAVMIVTTLDTFTSFMAGCTIFGILGNLAHEMGTDDIGTVVRGGTGLAFISYPEALARFPAVPQLFAVLFFIMMFVLGIGSAQSLVGVIASVITDRFTSFKQMYVVGVISIIGFLLGLTYVTPGGQWILTLVDYYGGTFTAIIVGVTEVTTIFWIYGLNNFLNDVEFMLGYRPGLYWRLCWLLITPLLMIIVLVYTFAVYEDVTYNDEYFPSAAYAFGWVIFSFGIIQLIFWICLALIKKRSSSIKLTFRRAFTPNRHWGPTDPKENQDWKAFCAERRQRSTGGLRNLFLG
ncbi:sodium-dependent nutrient amino acid transporter 1 [Neodiprion lecontei]|uniref:Transporter n=1 Tax=Neodiprion lecontei TaxID=441921 RepID=A0ABM3FPB8_NEOLC|nr:sodium-dependent nutrient amino acid transporter 1 [Neodiprion lecontei]